MYSSAEVTLEMDPGTFDYDRLLRLRDYGANRISMGVQSFDNAMLQHCGRPHSVEDARRALEALHRADWDNFSIDLISSLPHLTPQLWEDTLLQASNCGSSHISVYDLQLEPGTAFSRWYSPNSHPLPTETISADMYRTAVRVLGDANFEHYEVSNYALPGRRSRHNQKYWQCAPVLAFGMSAASYLQGQRFVRPRDMRKYEEYVEDLASWPITETSPHQPERQINPTIADVSETSKPSMTTAVKSGDSEHIPDMLDFLMLSLRTADGLDMSVFTVRYGEGNAEKVLGALGPYVHQGLVLLLDNHSAGRENNVNIVNNANNVNSLNGVNGVMSVNSEGSVNNNVNGANDVNGLISVNSEMSVNGCAGITRVRLSDPDGLMISNDIISSVFAVLPSNEAEE